MWDKLFFPDLPLLNLAIRAIAVFLGIVLLLRLSGKRQMGQLTATEFVVVLLISNAVQNAMNGGDNSLTGGMFLATILIGLAILVGTLCHRYRFMAYGSAASAAADFQQWPRAMRLYDRAVALMDEILILDPNRLTKREPVSILTDRALAASSLGDKAKMKSDLDRCRTIAAAIPVANARAADLRITGDCFVASAENAPPAQAAEYYREALRRFDEALNRPEPNEYLRPRRDKTAAALKAIP